MGGGRGGEMMMSYYSSNFENMYNSSNYKLDYMEKRGVFLRSYQFCRKRSFLQRLKLSLIRAKRLLLVKKMRVAVIRLKRLVWLNLRLRLGLGYPHRGAGGRGRFHFHPLTSASYSSRSWSGY